jgi:Rieske Fe-S protein
VEGEPIQPASRGDEVIDAAPVTRRRFLAWTAGLGAGAVAALLAAGGLPPVLGPAFRADAAGWTALGPVEGSAAGSADLSVAGTVVPTNLTRTVTDAFLPPEKQRIPVFLVSEGGGRFTVFDARCTHLGCPLTWSPSDRQFLCACHGGVYNAQGKVVGGPPPRPLDRYEVKVEGGVLYVGRLREG